MNIEMDLDLTFFADRLKFLRRVHNLTQENVAHACGLTTRTVEKLESGRHSPSEQTMRSLCRGLSIERGYFVKPTPAQEARQKAEMLKALRTTAVVRTTIVRTAQAVMNGFGGTHAWNLDVGEVAEEALPMAAALTDNVTDWSEVWDEISMSDQASAAAGLVESCRELEQAGYLVHLGRYQARRRFATGAPLLFTFGLLSIRSMAESENQSVALVPLADGWELLEKDVPKFDETD
ncbi:MAG: helix-turn-helix domain-containing protein [Phenylobacterium sp.]|uniref:helix-turn-helix domain-containing protein n=1 Tax=Phenylobacterium sp. TaxID=1871053 RepID=UPI0025D700EA|nr:helix-turn-helix transcriptional regulator [Phenylobacterium sp.]MBI1196229.1 helix-turn-helix domain-containing protein [Phenylobacterium sp.]